MNIAVITIKLWQWTLSERVNDYYYTAAGGDTCKLARLCAFLYDDEHNNDNDSLSASLILSARWLYNGPLTRPISIKSLLPTVAYYANNSDDNNIRFGSI